MLSCLIAKKDYIKFKQNSGTSLAKRTFPKSLPKLYLEHPILKITLINSYFRVQLLKFSFVTTLLVVIQMSVPLTMPMRCAQTIKTGTLGNISTQLRDEVSNFNDARFKV